MLATRTSKVYPLAFPQPAEAPDNNTAEMSPLCVPIIIVAQTHQRSDVLRTDKQDVERILFGA